MAGTALITGITGQDGSPRSIDSSKARQKLGWKPEVDFPALVKMIVDADLARLSHLPETPAGVELR